MMLVQWYLVTQCVLVIYICPSVDKIHILFKKLSNFQVLRFSNINNTQYPSILSQYTIILLRSVSRFYAWGDMLINAVITGCL